MRAMLKIANERQFPRQRFLIAIILKNTKTFASQVEFELNGLKFE